VNILSGGERVRVMLSKMMIMGANVLLMDEPTNHLDMESITALNNGMLKFPGAALFTSMDHQFVQTIANRIMEFTPNGLIDKITSYDEYLDSDDMARKRQAVVEVEAEIETGIEDGLEDGIETGIVTGIDTGIETGEAK
jgi:ABC-type sulfate/molybdate transport systems ATPase subunit